MRGGDHQAVPRKFRRKEFLEPKPPLSSSEVYRWASSIFLQNTYTQWPHDVPGTNRAQARRTHFLYFCALTLSRATFSTDTPGTSTAGTICQAVIVPLSTPGCTQRAGMPGGSRASWSGADALRILESIWHEHADSLSEQASSWHSSCIAYLPFSPFSTNPSLQVDVATQARVLSKAGLVMSAAPISRGAAEEVVRNPNGGEPRLKAFDEFMADFQR